MRKKINKKSNPNIKGKVIILSGLLILSVYISTSIAMASSGPVKAPLNPDFVKYQTNTNPTQPNPSTLHKTVIIPPTVNLSHIKSIHFTTSAPAYYDLRTMNKLTSVKDQGSAGACWAFATYGSLESYLMPQESRDFSENNLKNLLSAAYPDGFDRGANNGGNEFMSTAYLTRWSGPVNESDDPYSDTSTTSPTGLPIQKHVQDVIFVPDRQNSLDNQEIKDTIQKYGAVYTHMYYADANYSKNAYYYNGSLPINHAVDIVGWNDSYDKNNFSPVPSGNGAFIVRNSWGTNWGDNGYFYVSYYDSKIGIDNAAFTTENIDNYKNIYQYDPLGWTNNVGYQNTTCWCANDFTAKSNETLKAISFYATDNNCSYQIYVYTNPESGPISQAGSVFNQSGKCDLGYHTIHLNSGVQLNTSQRFSIILKLTTSGEAYPIAIEEPIPSYSSKATANTEESYISPDGNDWTDITTYFSNTNVCLKAFTDPTQNSALTITKTANPTTYNAVGQTITYNYTVTNSGSVPISAIGVNDNKTTVRINNGTLSPGSSVQGTAKYNITQTDINAGSVTNSAKAIGTVGTQTITSMPVTATVTAIAIQNPALTIVKTANPTTYNAVGQTITYNYTVTNSGSVPISAIEVNDNKTIVKINSGTLSPGSSVQGTAKYAITQADINKGSVTNIASAAGKFNGENVTSNQVTATITAVQSPALTITKTANPTTYNFVGRTITYAYTVTNSGNVPISAIGVNDNKTIVKINSDTLSPGSSVKGTAKYAITQADINKGSVTNIASAAGKFNGENVTSNQVTVLVKYRRR